MSSGETDTELLLNVPWEAELEPGPTGEYVEVTDYDPGCECFYVPVDLNAPSVVAQNGIAPAEGDPQFHQQMIYAWVMSTVRQFERNLGRAVLWSPRVVKEDSGKSREEFVQHLRIYPHALRSQQAYYSPTKKALLFGYSISERTSAANDLIQATSFTCLSPAITVHETTHAIFDGLGRVVAVDEIGSEQLDIQEAIGDMAGLLQQLAVPGFISNQMNITADLYENERRLDELARRLAQPLGNAKLRKNIGAAVAEPERSAPLVQRDRAPLLVASIFDTFKAVWRGRCERQLELVDSPLHNGRRLGGPILSRLSKEAEKSASQILGMFIRAIDYCPPVEATFGDYLRAVIAADSDLFPEDQRRYRPTMLEAFRRWGLYYADGEAPSPLDFVWPRLSQAVVFPVRGIAFKPVPAASRQEEFDREAARCLQLQKMWLAGASDKLPAEASRIMGLALNKDAPLSVERGASGLPRARVDSCRLARRINADGNVLTDWVVTLTQSRKAYFDSAVQAAHDAGEMQEKADFIFRGGSTLIIDATTLRIRYCAAKDILSIDQLTRKGELLQRRRQGLFGTPNRADIPEPFLALRSA